MGFFKFFRSRNEDASAKLAKDRLQVLIAHQRTNRDAPDYLPLLKRDIIAVIKKYVHVGEDQVSVSVDNQDEFDVLELNITLPDSDEAKRGGDGGGSALADKARDAIGGSASDRRKARRAAEAAAGKKTVSAS